MNQKTFNREIHEQKFPSFSRISRLKFPVFFFPFFAIYVFSAVKFFRLPLRVSA